MTKDEALKMAIEALDKLHDKEVIVMGLGTRWVDLLTPIQACKDALEQPAQTPVAWTDKHNLFLEFDKEWLCNQAVCKDNEAIPLYTQPAPSWQGLTDDEINKMVQTVSDDMYPWKGNMLIGKIIRAIEQALKEKND